MNQQTCPNCGYCPHCGRSAQPYQPIFPWVPPYHWWQQPYVIYYGQNTAGYTMTPSGTAGALVPTTLTTS